MWSGGTILAEGGEVVLEQQGGGLPSQPHGSQKDSLVYLLGRQAGWARPCRPCPAPKPYIPPPLPPSLSPLLSRQSPSPYSRDKGKAALVHKENHSAICMGTFLQVVLLCLSFSHGP